VSRHAPQPIAPGKARELLDHCGNGRAAIRNRAILAVLWRCGLRSQECASLELGDLVDLEGGALRLTVREPKGSKKKKNPTPPRVVGMEAAGAEILRAWLKERGTVKGSRLVFVTKTGRPIQTSYFRQMVPRIARRAGFPQRVHPHGLRHTFANELYSEGVGILEIQLLLGHTSLATTERYLKAIGASEAVKVATERTWK